MKNPPRDIIAHTPGTNKAEEWVGRKGQHEPGRENQFRTARDSTGIRDQDRDPIDPRMPHMPPA